MLVDLFQMLLYAAAALFGSALLLRAYMHWLRVGAYNPLAQFARALTDWAVRPLKMLQTRPGRWDWASLIGASLLALLYVCLVEALHGRGVIAWPWVVPLALGLLVRWSLYMVQMLVLIQALLSLVNPSAPLAPTFDTLTRPLLAPFRRAIPSVGGFDLSPLVVLVLTQVMLYVIDRSGI